MVTPVLHPWRECGHPPQPGLHRPVELVRGVHEDELPSLKVLPVVSQVEQRGVVERGVRLLKTHQTKKIVLWNSLNMLRSRIVQFMDNNWWIPRVWLRVGPNSTSSRILHRRRGNNHTQSNTNRDSSRIICRIPLPCPRAGASTRRAGSPPPLRWGGRRRWGGSGGGRTGRSQSARRQQRGPGKAIIANSTQITIGTWVCDIFILKKKDFGFPRLKCTGIRTKSWLPKTHNFPTKVLDFESS